MAAAVPREPEPPDYSDGGTDGGWLCHGGRGLPSLAQSYMTVGANGAPARSAAALAPHATGSAAAACFWVHPTLAHGGPYSNRATIGRSDASSIGFTLSQASAFSAGAAVWACRYRQLVVSSQAVCCRCL